jgi:hypothetical protein
MRKIIHVHQQEIKKNNPALIVRTYKGSKHFTKVEINGPSELIQSPVADHCGARVWISTNSEVICSDENDLVEVIK